MASTTPTKCRYKDTGWEKRKKLYLIWTIISLILLYIIVKANLQNYLFLIIIVLLLKDVFIDINILGLRKNRGPYPGWLEHAPFVILIALGGIFGFLNITNTVIFLSIIDAIIDIANDFGKI